jgi:hypothetical protein
VRHEEENTPLPWNVSETKFSNCCTRGQAIFETICFSTLLNSVGAEPTHVTSRVLNYDEKQGCPEYGKLLVHTANREKIREPKKRKYEDSRK